MKEPQISACVSGPQPVVEASDKRDCPKCGSRYTAPVCDGAGCGYRDGDVPPELLDDDEYFDSLALLRGQFHYLLTDWEQKVKRIADLEDRIRVADIMMQNMVQADMPKEISRESFRGFARCRLSQYRKIMGDVVEMDEKGGETTNSETIPGGQAG